MGPIEGAGSHDHPRSSVAVERKPRPDATLVTTFEAAPVGVIVVDRHGHICATNPAMQAMFGYTEHEMVGSSLEMLLPDEHRQRHRAERSAFALDPEARTMGRGRELRARHADGRTFPVDVAISAVPLPDGPGSVAVVVDKSPKLEVDSLFEGTFEAAPYGLAIVDREGMIVRVNRRLAQLVGSDSETLTGGHVSSVIPVRFQDDPTTNLARFYAEPTNQTMGLLRGLTVVHADGSEIPVEMGLAKLTSNRSTVSLVALNDTSEWNRMTQRLRDANIEMEEFTHVASHDLKSPLRGVSDLVEWITEELGDEASASVANNLDRIRTRVQRMELLIEQLLAYARIGRTSISHQPIEMDALVDDALELVSVPVTFTIDLDVQVEPFVGSSTPLETIIRNLVSNAIKHHDRTDGTITIRAHSVNQTCSIEVSDDGPGIPPAAHTRIFGLFQTANSRHADNAGVGLAVCRRLCDANGASIEVHSGHPERGSTFVVEWPLVSMRHAYDD